MLFFRLVSFFDMEHSVNSTGPVAVFLYPRKRKVSAEQSGVDNMTQILRIMTLKW